VQIYRSLDEFIQHLGMRLTGPLQFRFILQPLVALVLGVRDGLRDAKAGRPPYLWDLIVNPEGRARQVSRGLASLGRPMIVAVVIDAIVQYLMFRAVYPGAAVLVGVTVLGLPYVLARAIVNRAASARRARVPSGRAISR
jgi:hypothetical protein